MGNLVSADNRDALVRRGYATSGLMTGDTVWIRTVTEGGGFGQHRYGLEFTHDLSGRRVELKHPANLAATGQDRARWTYDPQLGSLTEVTDPLGNRFRYHYNARGEVDSLYLPGGITEAYTYDQDGRLGLHRTFTTGTTPDHYVGPLLRDQVFTYDLRGKLLSDSNRVGMRDFTQATYSGLGHLRTSTTVSFGAELNYTVPSSTTTETVSHDALANRRSARVTSTFYMPGYFREQTDAETFHYQSGTGRHRSTHTRYQRDTVTYDGAGNVEFSTTYYHVPDATAVDLRDQAYFYAADGKLRAAEQRIVDDPTIVDEQSSYRRSFEEYRYDALGRRVWVRARRECDDGSFAALCELSWVRRTVWDGDRELYEIQAPGAETLADSVHMENDAGHLNLGMRTAEPPDGKALDPNPFYGRVAYTYGLGIDQPLSLVRTGYGDRADAGGNDTGLFRALGAFAVIPLWNHRGQAVLGVFSDGKWRQCVSLGGHNRCIFIGWPELWAGYARPRIHPTFWHGSLIGDKQDASGLHYRRNRYYDPATGRFTQEDPIGLAGGLNVYGFAAGDPVSYSDPSGLCAASQVNHDTGLCPGGLTHGQYYQMEDGFFMPQRYPCARNAQGRCVTYPPVQQWSRIGQIFNRIPDSPEFCAGAKAALLDLWNRGVEAYRIRFWDGYDVHEMHEGGQRFGQRLSDRDGSFIEFDSHWFFRDRTLAPHEGLHEYYNRNPHPTLIGRPLHRLIHQQDDVCAWR